MFLLRRGATVAALRKRGFATKPQKKIRKRKKIESKDSRAITGCIGLAIRLGERHNNDPRPARLGCSSRCRHASHIKDGILCSGHGKTDDWISEDIYKRFTETDSRPLTPDQHTRRTVTLHRSSSVALEITRKCVTPEPDTKQCQFHNRRVLILDLRRVKSVDAITRQNSITTGESVDSTYGDYDYDNRSSSVNRDSSSVFHHSTPRNFSVSRSTSPKGSKLKGRVKRPKERSGSPLAYERSSSPKILEGLTLPPLHQSVLTLLGQKSGVKSSPRNHVIHELVGSGFDSANNQKAKKLRRHGRKKKTKDEGKESEEKEIEKPETTFTTDGRGDNDELQETQLNTLQNDAGLNEDEESGGAFVQSPTYLKEIKSLRDVLDEHLCREQWSQKEMEYVNEEIEKLSLGLKKYQTEFKSKSISMTEESWLAFPRTCTHTTARFGVPSNWKTLKDLTPVEYLKNYVMILEPRLHLYNLIYQRYRTLENPTGTNITIKSLQRALTEVLGRQFDDKEMQQLQNSYLKVKDNHELDSATFAGICAFSERIFGKYKLEICNNCIVCSKQKVADKERCHVKRKSALEDMDLAYMSNKIRFGETNVSMCTLIEALTRTDSELLNEIMN